MNEYNIDGSVRVGQSSESDYLACCQWPLARTGASRTTIRVVGAGGSAELIAEALAAGVRSIRSGTQVDPTRYATYRHLERTHALLIQADTRVHPIRPPESLVNEFRVYAQMLAPIVRDGRLTGVISVHIQDRPHRFDRAQISALRSAQHRLAARPVDVIPRTTPQPPSDLRRSSS